MGSSEWHYQVMKHVEYHLDGSEEVWYGVHEYYPKLEGSPAFTDKAILNGESLEDLKEVLKMIEQDIYRHGVKDYD